MKGLRSIVMGLCMFGAIVITFFGLWRWCVGSYALFRDYFEWSASVSVILCVVCLIPPLGPVCGVAGACCAWHWTYGQALIYMLWPLALFGVLYGIGSFLYDKKEKETPD